MICNSLKILFLISLVVYYVDGHGYMTNPEMRGQYCTNPTTNRNFTCADNLARWCDFHTYQWYYRGGKCDACGENSALGNGAWNHGKNLGQVGPIKATYKSGDKISITGLIGDHWGYMRVRLCKLNGKEAPTQDCFNQNSLRLEIIEQSHWNATNKVQQLDDYTLLTPGVGNRFKYNSTFNAYLPTGLSCDNCVLQWEWHTTDQARYCRSINGTVTMRNSYSTDYNDSPCITQRFRSCADIKINSIPNQPALKQTPYIIKNKELTFSCMANRDERSNGPIQRNTTPDPLNASTAHGMICIMSMQQFQSTSDGFLVNTFCPNCYNNCFLPGKTCPQECYCRWFKRYL